MGVNWTKEQLQVIEMRGCNMLVSAAAGSGKTAVLVERILSMIMDQRHPVDIDRLLIVTFTNAAAGEMRDRIREAIEEKIEELEQSEDNPEWLLDHLQRQTALLSNAQITTIHSFCQYVIRNYFHTIDLDPSMRIADEGEQKLLQNDVLKDLLEEKYAEQSEEFLKMTESMAPGRDDGALVDIVLSLYSFSQSFPWPEKWLIQCRQTYDISSAEELNASDWIKSLTEFVRAALQDVKQQIEEAINIAAEEDGPWFYEDALQADMAAIEEILSAATYSEQSGCFSRLPGWTRLSVKKDKTVSEEKKERIKAIREEYKKTVGDLRENFYFAPADSVIRQMKECLPVVEELTRLTDEFSRRYLEEKQKKNLMDFNDMEHFALKILVNNEGEKEKQSQVAQDLAARYEEIMIDEYQDSNFVQELILGSVSGMREGRHNTFMVGDVKQSIYRFRLARPELFMEKYHTYSVEEGDCRRIDLHRNFRSRHEVLDGVNFIFEQIMEERLGNIQYDEAAALYPGAEFETGDDPDFRDTEVLMLDLSAQEGTESAEESDREAEARMTAGRIREMVGKERIWDKERRKYRTIQYGDIVVLLRTVQGWAEVFSKMMTDLGIPASTGSRTGYFSTAEIQTVLSLLKLIDNPLQDIPMAAVLRSPVVGLSGKEMADIRSRHPDRSFSMACMEEEKLTDFFEMLREFRVMANDVPIHELLMYILERTGYGNYAAAMPGGSQRKANLDMLVEKAIAYEQGSYRGLYNFVRYIENLHKYDVDYGEANVGGQENAVRIMSIHKSKGLEFPVVFVCGMGKMMNQSDARSTVLSHAELGIGCDYVNLELRTKSRTLLKEIMKKETHLESLGEELRVLYVAFTRAKEKLVLTGTISKTEDKIRKWANVCGREEKVLPFIQRTHASTYWDWVIPALMRNKCFTEILDTFEIVQNRNHPLYDREIFVNVRIVWPERLVEQEMARQENYLYTEKQLLEFPVHQVIDEKIAAELEEKLSFGYAYEKDAEIPGKVSVSELKKMSAQEKEEGIFSLYEEAQPVPLIPEFLQEEHTVSGAARGTVYHRWMECVDFTLFGNKSDGSRREQAFALEKERMLQQGYLSKEEISLIDMKKMEAFFSTSLAKRMAEADSKGNLFRERQFVLDVPADNIRKEWNPQQKVLIQGIIDAYFIEDGEIVLLDYKTDYVKMKDASSLYRKYGVQLECYKKALERLTGLPVKEKLIYSFCLDSILLEEE
ncbi:MAG: helicase-exonuclease AddAB subunit AddA [Eubacteriales bacterium]|nr:helicase-exonuclease AddAB subunit AddA [Eubacteriales bacterium]